MLRARLHRTVKTVAGVYGFALLLGIVLRAWDRTPDNLAYATYRDLIPLTVALPAAFLAYAFQRRMAYLQGLRTVWANMITAVGGAVAYTEIPAPSKEMHIVALQRLSSVIEEIRGFYANVPAGVGPGGWYPFEPLKQIYSVVRDLGFGDKATDTARSDAQDAIYAMWKRTRSRFVAELDTEVPLHHHAGYAPASGAP